MTRRSENAPREVALNVHARAKGAPLVRCLILESWRYERSMACRVFGSGVVIVLLAGLACTGCTTVAPYERGRLAHPTMTTADLAGPAEAHARAIQEGATGGSFEAGGGCGCN